MSPPRVIRHVAGLRPFRRSGFRVAAEIDYITLGPAGLYMVPRQDGIVLGGTSGRGEWSLEPNPAEIDRILRGHTVMFESMG
jgi:hypothetical protein